MSSEKTASAGYQFGSEGTSRFSETPAPASDEENASDPEPSQSPDDGLMDPFEAFAEVQRKIAKEKAGRDPALWLPGEAELDQEPTDPERETRYAVDAHRLKGTPQVGVRLRQTDFERLRRAADVYGVRPTTLARMMVLRGIKAILDADLRQNGIG